MYSSNFLVRKRYHQVRARTACHLNSLFPMSLSPSSTSPCMTHPHIHPPPPPTHYPYRLNAVSLHTDADHLIFITLITLFFVSYPRAIYYPIFLMLLHIATATYGYRCTFNEPDNYHKRIQPCTTDTTQPQ